MTLDELSEKAGAALNWPGYIEVRADAVLALVGAVKALEKNVSADILAPCRLDHNGNCQEHYVESPCRVAEARAALSNLKQAGIDVAERAREVR